MLCEVPPGMDPARARAEGRSLLGMASGDLGLRIAKGRSRTPSVVDRSRSRVLARGHGRVSAKDTRRRDRAWIAVLALVVLSLAGSAVVRGDGPLMTADLVRFLKAGISESTILTELETRGFGETLESAREATLRSAGATETLIVAVRRLAPAVPPDRPAATT